MITYTGKSLWPPHSPEFGEDVIDLESIAVGLGRQSRFAGQTAEFYTVLCHVLVVADLVSGEYRRHALLHDAAEAVMGDCPTTWKPDSFKQLEPEIVLPVSREYGVEWTEQASRVIFEADYAALAAEAHALGHRAAEKYWPQREFTPLMQRAYILTRQRLWDEDPYVLLDADTAIRAFREAWER